MLWCSGKAETQDVPVEDSKFSRLMELNQQHNTSESIIASSSFFKPIYALSGIIRRRSFSSCAEWATGIKISTNDMINMCNRMYFVILSIITIEYIKS